MALPGALEDARLTLLFWPLVARVRWQLWRVPIASNTATWREGATRELSAALTRNHNPLVPFEVWRRAHAIGRAARFVPGASCLTQALALQTVLSRCGEATSLVLGVDRNATTTRDFEAHAWIEWQGRVLIGGPIERWKPLLTVAPTVPSTTSGEKAPTSEPSLQGATSPLQ